MKNQIQGGSTGAYRLSGGFRGAAIARGRPDATDRTPSGDLEKATERRQGPPPSGLDTPEVSGSNPFPGTNIKWPKITLDERVGLPECPYLRRWIVDLGAFSIRLHRWQSSDDERAFHDHPWWFVTLVIWGGYVDESPDGRDRLRAGSVRFRPAIHRHTVRVTRPGTWTVMITGRSIRRWGFWEGERSLRRDKYFAQRGHHPCLPGGAAVRMKPNGDRIPGKTTP